MTSNRVSELERAATSALTSKTATETKMKEEMKLIEEKREQERKQSQVEEEEVKEVIFLLCIIIRVLRFYVILFFSWRML